VTSIRRELLMVTIILVTAVVFTVDVLTPHSVHVWVLYLPVILAPVWFNNARQVVILAVVSSVLLVVGDLLTATDSGPSWWDLMNVVMGLTTVWLAAVAGIILCRRSNRLSQLTMKLQSDIARRKELEREVLETSAREQQRIGQELHDGVGQELTGLGLMANALTQRLQHSVAEQRIAARLVAGLDQVHQQVRTLTRGLVPVEVEAAGLCAALDDLVASASDQSGIPVTFDCPNRVEVPDHSTATHLYRIAQEAVSNALRHGQARQVNLALQGEPSGLRLSIQDDGIGMRDEPERTEGMGLRIMQYRCEQIGGVLEIGPAVGGGTVVKCRVSGKNCHEHFEPRNGAAAPQGLDRG
jgi:signal transduction histidine kinase